MKALGIISNNSFAALFSKVFSAALSFLFIWTIARSLSTSDSGVFFYTYNLMMIIVQMSRAGTEHSLIKLISGAQDARDGRNTTHKTMIYVLSACSLCIMVAFGINLLYPLEVYRSTEAFRVLEIFFIVSLLASATQVLASYFQARSEVYSQYWALNVGMMLLASGYALFVFIAGSSVSVLRMSWVFASICLVVLLSCLLLFQGSLARFENRDIGISQELSLAGLASKTLPYAAVTLLSIITLWGGQLIAGMWLDEVELAVMAVCMRLAFLVNFVHMTFSALLAPRIARLHAEGALDSLEETISLHSFIAKLYAVGVFLLFLVLGRPILLSFGEEYVAGYGALVAMSLAWLVVSCLGPVNTILLMTDHAARSRRFLMVSGAVTVLSALYFVPNHGVIGVVLATSLGSVLLPILCGVQVWKTYHVNFFDMRVTRRQLGEISWAARSFFSTRGRLGIEDDAK